MDGAIDMDEGMTLAAFEALAATAPFDARWELVAGRLVRGRYGEPWEHATIIRNIAAKLGNDLELRGQSYQTFTETFYVKSRPLGMAMLPDVLVVGGGLTPGATSIDNPIVLFEILSPDTEARDRSEKWRAYRQLPALRHYVLVARDDARLEVYDRADGVWSASSRGSMPPWICSRFGRRCCCARSMAASSPAERRAAKPGAQGLDAYSASGAIGSRPPMWRCA